MLGIPVNIYTLPDHINGPYHKVALIHQIEQSEDNLPVWVNGSNVILTRESLLKFFSGSGSLIMHNNKIPDSSAEKESSPITFKEQLDILLNSGLSVTAISNIMKVTRPTIYNWQSDNSNPHPSTQSRMDQLISLLSELDKKELSFLEKVWLRKVNDNKSLYELFSAEELNNSAIQSYIQSVRPLIAKISTRIQAPRKLLSQQIAEMNEMGNPVVSGWDSLSPVGKELDGFRDDDI